MIVGVNYSYCLMLHITLLNKTIHVYSIHYTSVLLGRCVKFQDTYNRRGDASTYVYTNAGVSWSLGLDLQYKCYTWGMRLCYTAMVVEQYTLS